MSILTQSLLPALSIHILLTFHLPSPCLPYLTIHHHHHRRPMNKKDAYVNANTVATHRNEMKAERLKRREEKGRVEKNKSGKDGYDMSQKGKEDKRPHTNKGSKSATAGRNSYSATEAAANDGDLGEPVANLGLRAPRVGGKTAGKGVGVKGETRRTSPQTPVQPAVEVYDEKSAMGDSPAGSAARQVDLRYNKTAAYEYVVESFTSFLSLTMTIMIIMGVVMMMNILTSAISASCSFYSYIPPLLLPSPSLTIPLL